VTQQQALIDVCGLARFFQSVQIAPNEDKFPLCEQLLMDWEMDPSWIAAVDDRTAQRRSLHWAATVGAKPIWCRRGGFTGEEPQGYEIWRTIYSLPELKPFLGL